MRSEFHDDLWEDWEDCEKWGGFGDCGKGYRVSACYGMLADVALLARKSEGFGFI